MTLKFRFHHNTCACEWLPIMLINLTFRFLRNGKYLYAHIYKSNLLKRTCPLHCCNFEFRLVSCGQAILYYKYSSRCVK